MLEHRVTSRSWRYGDSLRRHPTDCVILNILVATIGSFQFWRAGHFSWKLFWPFALLSVPAAYLGGYLQLPASILKILIGLVLIFSAVRLIFRRRDPATVNPPTLPVALGIGGAIGFFQA